MIPSSSWSPKYATVIVAYSSPTQLSCNLVAIKNKERDLKRDVRACILNPTGRIVLGEGNEAIVVLIVKLHLPLRAMQDLALGLLEVPLSQLVLRHEPIGGVHIDLREQEYQPVGNIKLVLVIEVILGVHEVLPLGLGLVGRGRVRLQFGQGLVDYLLLPLLVFAVPLEFGDERVEGDGVVARGGEGEVGAQLEAAVAVAGVLIRGMGEEYEKRRCDEYVNENRRFGHRC